MKPLMYRQRPAFPALVGAVVSLIGGAFCYGTVYSRVQSGDIPEENLTALILVSIAITLIFLVAAFARYRFTHLWMKPRARSRGKKPSRM